MEWDDGGRTGETGRNLEWVNNAEMYCSLEYQRRVWSFSTVAVVFFIQGGAVVGNVQYHTTAFSYFFLWFPSAITVTNPSYYTVRRK